MAQPQLDLAHFRQRLEEVRAGVEREVEGLVPETQNLNQDTSYGAKNHPAEDATELFTRERGLAIQARLQDELAQIDHALQRIADGTYGICEDGGEAIPVERLEARPAATLCIQHQRERDQHAREIV